MQELADKINRSGRTRVDEESAYRRRMKLVTDANVVMSAPIADSKTQALSVTIEPDLLTPAFVSDEIESYEELLVETSGLHPD